MVNKKDYLIKFGKNIKNLRIAKNLSQDELAHLCGYDSRSSINKIELGINDVPQSKIKLIANALNVSISELLDCEEISKEAKIYDLISEIYGERICEAIHMYLQLDTMDQAEIRGEMKNMLKADKYSTKDGSESA